MIQQVLQVALESSVAIDSALLDSPCSVQARSRNLQGAGFWSDWSSPYNLSLGGRTPAGFGIKLIFQSAGVWDKADFPVCCVDLVLEDLSWDEKSHGSFSCLALPEAQLFPCARLDLGILQNTPLWLSLPHQHLLRPTKSSFPSFCIFSWQLWTSPEFIFFLLLSLTSGFGFVAELKAHSKMKCTFCTVQPGLQCWALWKNWLSDYFVVFFHVLLGIPWEYFGLCCHRNSLNHWCFSWAPAPRTKSWKKSFFSNKTLNNRS